MKKYLIDWFSGGTPYPATLPNVLAWWDNGAVYMSSDGSQWTDRISGLNATAAGSARPTFTASAQNGRPGFTFDGVANALTRSRITQIQGLSGLTIWSVGRRSSISHDSGANFRTNLLHYNVDDVRYAVVHNNGAPEYGAIQSSNIFSYDVMVFDGSLSGNANRLKLWALGTQQTLGFQGTIPATTENTAATFKIGSTITLFISGVSLEHGIITRAITGAEVTLLNSYLAAKYAL